MDFEICIDNFLCAQAAAKYPIKRLEVCSALSLGGLSPSLAIVEQCCSLGPETHVMLRPRAGDFNYVESEINQMLAEMRFLEQLNIDGVVFGCLNEDGALHEPYNRQLLEAAKRNNWEVTFHRAIDYSSDLSSALDKLMEWKFDRVLTSGGAKKAIEGKTQIKELARQAKKQIQIMAGSGVRSGNAQELANLGVDALHFSAHKYPDGEQLEMGSKTLPNEEKIKSILKLFAG